MPKYNKRKKVEITFYIQQGDFKEVISNLTDPSPTIFEDTKGTEVRFSVLINNQEDFLRYHALDKYHKETITIGLIYENGIELKSTFHVTDYERRFGSDKGSIVTHLFKGVKHA